MTDSTIMYRNSAPSACSLSMHRIEQVLFVFIYLLLFICFYLRVCESFVEDIAIN